MNASNPQLTDKQMRFVDEYCIDLNASQAALRAGYSSRTGYSIGTSLLTKPHVKNAIAQRMQKLAEKSRITQEWVIERLKDIVDRCMQVEPVLKNGEPIGEYQFKPEAATRGLELLGKHIGMFTDRVRLEGVVPVVISGGDQLDD